MGDPNLELSRDTASDEMAATATRSIAYFILPMLVIVGALIAYKSSAALAVIGKVSATGGFTPRGNIVPRVGASDAGVLTRTLNYLLVIWPALLFGIVITAAVSTFVSASVLLSLLSQRALRSQRT